MVRIHVVIATYGGIYKHRFHVDQDKKERFLRYHMAILNQCNMPEIARITITKPAIDPKHTAIENYYNFNDIDVRHIKDKIHVLECPNQGISYGQFLRALFTTHDDYDYHIFLEDDYVIFHPETGMLLVEEYMKKKKNPLFLTMGISKHTCIDQALKQYNYHLHDVRLDNGRTVKTHIPDFSIGIIDKESVQCLVQRYSDVESAVNDLGQHDILTCQATFGYMLCKCGIEVQDTDDYLAIFWDNGMCAVQFVNLITDYHDIIKRAFDPAEKRYKCPLVVPMDILYDPHKVDDIVKKYITEESKFDASIKAIRSVIGMI